MTISNNYDAFRKNNCLTDDDLYLYISGQGEAGKMDPIEAHLERCSSCRQDLAALLRILHPDTELTDLGISEPSRADLDQTIALVQKISRKESPSKKLFPRRFQWPVAAAAAVGIIVFSLWGFKYFNETRKSERFFLQAKAVLEQTYPGTSPSNLRLALPFGVTSTNRSDPGGESSRRAENLLFQALAIRENMVEAHLGLAFIYLNELKPARARNEFQKVLEIQKKNIQALIGRGVAQYEEAVQVPDPLQRSALLQGALNDFEEALKLDPGSMEARYNKIWTLFESGHHKEALKEIDLYLADDSGSIWAEGLKQLKIKMRATQISDVEDVVRSSAPTRNSIALKELAYQAPYQMPAAIKFAMTQSLELEQDAITNTHPNSEDFRWAAQIMETAYSESTGDTSFKAYFAFYGGLSPPQRAWKRRLDGEFQEINRLYRNSNFETVLTRSKSLKQQYTKLGDFWQLAALYHLCGNSLYLGESDFPATEAEFRKMLEIAERIHALDFKAKAIGSLAMIDGMQRKFDESIYYVNMLKALAQSHHLESLNTYAFIIRGNQLLRLGQLEKSLHEYSTALEMAYRTLDGVSIIQTLENLGLVMDGLGRFQEAKAYYSLALRWHEEFLKSRVIPDIPETFIRRLNLLHMQGILALRTNDFNSAEKFFNESLKSAKSGMNELKGRNYIGLAEVFLNTDRDRQAETMLEDATGVCALGQYPDLEWKTRFIKGRLLERSGQYRQAIHSFKEAIEILEHMRENIRLNELRRSFLTDRYDPFKTMVSLLYKHPVDERKALEFIDRAKSITLKEQLRLPDSITQFPNKKLRTDSDYTILEYFFADNELLIFLTRQGHVESVSRRISSLEISRQVKEYLESIRGNDGKTFDKISRRLYDELIAPFEKHALMDPSGILVILPDGPLHLLPFSGLQDPNGIFIVEKAPVAFAPSRSVFQHCLSLNRDMDFDNFHATLIDGSAGLPSAKAELVYLSILYGRNASILTPDDVPLFKQAVTRSEIVHFSGHAIDKQGQPVLLLQKHPKEVYLDCQSINTWKMPKASLVNLAGCSTGIGPLSEGEAPWGLIPAFLNAGSPSIIASLMPVDDSATRRLSCQFYELLRQGKSKARALQLAQISLLESARSSSHIKPQTWAPYVLVGNPQ